MMTLRGAARLSRLNRSALKHAIRSGDLAATKTSGAYLIEPDELNRYCREHPSIERNESAE
jgi:hypothetical protein